MDRIQVTVGYEMGHYYNEQWYHDEDLHCPECGSRSVWIEDDPGDYYSGPHHLCISCGCGFELLYCGIRDDIPYEADVQRKSQITYYLLPSLGGNGDKTDV